MRTVAKASPGAEDKRNPGRRGGPGVRVSVDSGLNHSGSSGCGAVLPVHEERAAEGEQPDQRLCGGQPLGDGDAEPSGVVAVVQLTAGDGGKHFVGDLANGFDLGGLLCCVALQLVLLLAKAINVYVDYIPDGTGKKNFAVRLLRFVIKTQFITGAVSAFYITGSVLADARTMFAAPASGNGLQLFL